MAAKALCKALGVGMAAGSRYYVFGLAGGGITGHIRKVKVYRMAHALTPNKFYHSPCRLCISACDYRGTEVEWWAL